MPHVPYALMIGVSMFRWKGGDASFLPSVGLLLTYSIMGILKDFTVVATISGVTTLNVFVQGALTVAITSIGKDLRFRETDLQWPVNAFLLSYASLLLFFGRIGDICGHKNVFLCGTAWFAAWSLASAFAPKSYVFIIFMACNGIGIAAITPAAIGSCTTYFPPGASRNRAFGILGGAQPVGFILGLLLGGEIAGSRVTWRAIFYVQTGLAILFMLLGLIFLPNDAGGKRYTKGIDFGGVLLSVTGVALLTFSIANAPSSPKGWATPYILVLLLASIVLLVCFVLLEHSRTKVHKSVLIPMKISRSSGGKKLIILSTVFFAWWSFDALMYFFTLLKPIETSIRFIPMVLSGIAVNIGAGFLMHRLNGQALILIGLIGNAVAALLYALIDNNLSYWKMGLFMMILNPFCDIIYPIGTVLLTSAFDADSQALAGGLFNVATSLGASVGLDVTSCISTARQLNFVHQPVP
ncbi:hypothetical protein M422DRAFT_272920 [Sphaerobolus stellatus SS14]|uniref:Major facilitator superfamily (MFS) profile domain-containing protein n=1 Tax=Sphaerobolus stellatus (strain SS14) TaxID=990650 RepID=A0A0C9TAE3_SPHS4|nr:hypothetical protein M422DRAFT_272920 [Sphaerobolus stellatus SS14]